MCEVVEDVEYEKRVSPAVPDVSVVLVGAAGALKSSEYKALVVCLHFFTSDHIRVCKNHKLQPLQAALAKSTWEGGYTMRHFEKTHSRLVDCLRTGCRRFQQRCTQLCPELNKCAGAVAAVAGEFKLTEPLFSWCGSFPTRSK